MRFLRFALFLLLDSRSFLRLFSPETHLRDEQTHSYGTRPRTIYHTLYRRRGPEPACTRCSRRSRRKGHKSRALFAAMMGSRDFPRNWELWRG
uniref:Putative secreted protein n=1 Tax=Anopheles marajoara TaxID=58244 RepID=A0A2M4C9L0_9DIPT